MRHPRQHRTRRWGFLALGLWLVLGAGVAAGQSRPVGLTAQEQLELHTLARQLTEPGRSAQTKHEAALILLGKPQPLAIETLQACLASTDAAQRPARIAVARAIALTGAGGADYAEPLLGMLADTDADVRAAAADALATYKDAGVLEALAQLSHDQQAAPESRLAAIAALSRMLDKRAVDTLMGLLETPEGPVHTAASAGLARLTGIRGFGDDVQRWRAWWQQNKDKGRQEWLVDLADSLTRQNTHLMGENDRLRARLAEAMVELYNATAANDRPRLLLALLNDRLAEVRLAGLRLSLRRATSDEPLTPESFEMTAKLLADASADVRSAAAALLAALDGPDATARLLGQLEVEAAPAVRVAVVAALGALRDPAAVEPLLEVVLTEPNGTSQAAAEALERIVERGQLTELQLMRCTEVLIARYADSGESSPQLREALLGAMGALGQARCAPTLRSALTDPVATVRLSAVQGLLQLRDTESASAVSALVTDDDRGVRLAAISALGALGGLEPLDQILSRTRPDTEPDPLVRQRAWETAMTLLDDAPDARLEQACLDLADWPDARDHRIRLLQTRLERLTGQTPRLVPVYLDLADALQQAGRPSEAAAQLAAARKLLDGQPDQAGALWVRWIQALLAADDPSSLALLAEQTDPALFAQGLECLDTRLVELSAAGKPELVIRLGDQALQRLQTRLTPAQLKGLSANLQAARAAQAQADRARVAALVPALLGADEPARQSALTEMQTLGPRALAPLVEQLQQAAAAETPDLPTEQALADLLARLAPQLTGYDCQADPAAKAQLLQTWRTQIAATTRPATGQ